MFSEVKSLTRRVIRHWGYELTPVQAAMPKAVRSDYEPLMEILGTYRFKFLDVKTFLPLTIARAYFIGLHESKGLDILDIGTGTGYFPVVCKYYGHNPIAIDWDGNEVFKDVTRWLAVDRRSWYIKPFQPIPSLGQRFDLVTAFMVNFDRMGMDRKPWTTKEWDFFLFDLACTHLKDGGRVVLLLNDHSYKVKSVMEYFSLKGARVDGAWVDFKTLSAYQQRSVSC
jgi:SAM-dependent methyltransferase